MKLKMAVAAALVAGSAIASDPANIVGVFANGIDGFTSLTMLQSGDCNGAWHNVITSGPKTDKHEAMSGYGCWHFNDADATVTIVWSDGDLRKYPDSAIEFSDWFKELMHKDAAKPMKLKPSVHDTQS